MENQMKVFGKLIAAAVVALASTVYAQTVAFPTRTVRVVMGYGVGGSGDVILRALANKLSQTWGQPVIVDNKPGGNEVVAAVEVARQPADGHTLIFASDSMFSLNPLLRSKPGYDPVKDFAPITRVFQSPLMVFVRPDFPANNMAEFIAYARTNPGKLNYATTGNGGTNHLAVSWLSQLYGLDMVQAPYNSVANVMQDLTTSRVDLSMLASGPSMPFVNAGKLKALAVTGSSRLPIAPSVPTFAEAGYAEYDSGFYMGLAAPAGTAQATTSKIAADVATALRSPEMATLLQQIGVRAAGEAPAEFTSFLALDRISATKRVEAARIKID
jgi:tripartite-type tricarboxylate transporter receptor subunit TctC